MNTTVTFEIISRYGLIAVFTIIALEYACFPLPSEIVLPFVLLIIFIVVCKIKRDKNSGRKTAEIKSKRI